MAPRSAGLRIAAVSRLPSPISGNSRRAAGLECRTSERRSSKRNGSGKASARPPRIARRSSAETVAAISTLQRNRTVTESAGATCHKTGGDAPSHQRETAMADAEQTFDIENPELPKWIKKGALKSGGYPYDKRMDDDDYLKELRILQLELVKLQTHMLKTGGRMIILFEGRDAAGKGGAVDAFREHLNGRYWLDVALPKPSD